MGQASQNRRVPENAPFFFVLNQGSGSGDAKVTEAAITATLREAGRDFRVLKVKHPRDLDALAQQAVGLAREHDGVVGVVGGDGTINAVTQRVLPSDLPFAVLAQGTFNFFGRTHALPLGDAGAGMRQLLDAAITPVQVGMVNGRAFLVNASLGLYPNLLQLREVHKQHFGRHRWVALGSGLLALMGHYPRMRLRLCADGQTRDLRTATLVVGNNRLQLSNMGLTEAPLVEQHRLVGIMVNHTSRLRMLGVALRGLTGHMQAEENVTTLSFEVLDVELRKPRRIKLALDGEITHMRAPLRFELSPHALQLLVPDVHGDLR